MEAGGGLDVTGVLRAWSGGDQTALERLVPILDKELHAIARRYMRREKPGHTLQATALVNEAYLRLVDVSQASWHDRAHFLAVCAQIMRRILVDHARACRSGKRGRGVAAVTLDEALAVSPVAGPDVVAVDEALTAFAKIDPRKAKVVELRFFGGLSVEETAAALRISVESVARDWRLAKVWLLRELGGGRRHGCGALATD
jgi:RNA polymerase sigma-70 factor, ECF subfamily